jgi:hypothetical protein
MLPSYLYKNGVSLTRHVERCIGTLSRFFISTFNFTWPRRRDQTIGLEEMASNSTPWAKGYWEEPKDLGLDRQEWPYPSQPHTSSFARRSKLSAGSAKAFCKAIIILALECFKARYSLLDWAPGGWKEPKNWRDEWTDIDCHPD